MVFLSGTVVPARSTNTREELLKKYHCRLTDLLRQVFEAPSAYQERNRYLILTGLGRSDNYVQCMFAANRTKLYCEVSSGYYESAMDKPRRHFPSEDVKAAFRRLGFSTGNEEKNYPYERDFAGVPDFGAIATLMLSAMHDGFGARAETPLIAKSPFARRVTMDCSGVSVKDEKPFIERQ
ncbi:MAG TPA: hypothetical protein VGC86_13025 [Afipia sp.]